MAHHPCICAPKRRLPALFAPRGPSGRRARRRVRAGAGAAALLACLMAFCKADQALAERPAAERAAERACDAAALGAARATGVPLEVLQTIARIESGRGRGGRLTPWPWTVNMEGTGKWFESASETLAYLERHLARGARSFDVGCFQINYRWHGHAFGALAQMLDPQSNALYAARFLAELHAELGSWPRAVGAYHSRTPVHARRYLSKFEQARAALAQAPEPGPPPAPGLRETAAPPARLADAGTGLGGAAPLFLSTRGPAPGSLVALPEGRGTLLLQPER